MNKKGCAEYVFIIIFVLLIISIFVFLISYSGKEMELKTKACKELGYDHYQMYYNPYCVSKDAKSKVEIADIDCNFKRCNLMLK
jgi:hypothetical protein